MRIGVLSVPGSLLEQDMNRVLGGCGHEPVRLSPRRHDLRRVDGVVLSGPFAAGQEGTTLNTSAPLMHDILIGVDRGMPLLGLGSGCRFLCAAGLLPGAIVRHEHAGPDRRERTIEVTSTDTSWSRSFTTSARFAVPVTAGTGCFVEGDLARHRLEQENRIVARFLDAQLLDGQFPDESDAASGCDVAGVANADGNVVGLLVNPTVEPPADSDGASAFEPAGETWLGFFDEVAPMLSRGVLV